MDDLLIGNPEVTGSVSNLAHFQNLFGDIPSLDEDPDRNPVLAAKAAAKTGLMPAVYMTCGTEDLLCTRNRKVCSQLQQAGADVTWTEDAGDHRWDFFAPAMIRMAKWLYQEI